MTLKRATYWSMRSAGIPEHACKPRLVKGYSVSHVCRQMSLNRAACTSALAFQRCVSADCFPSCSCSSAAMPEAEAPERCASSTHASNLATCALHPYLVPDTEDLKSTRITCRPCVKYLVLTSKMHR